MAQEGLSCRLPLFLMLGLWLRLPPPRSSQDGNDFNATAPLVRLRLCTNKGPGAD